MKNNNDKIIISLNFSVISSSIKILNSYNTTFSFVQYILIFTGKVTRIQYYNLRSIQKVFKIFGKYINGHSYSKYYINSNQQMSLRY